jgi:hypothetical protein
MNTRSNGFNANIWRKNLMKEPKFTNWVKWVDRTSLSEVGCPGVYCIVIF